MKTLIAILAVACIGATWTFDRSGPPPMDMVFTGTIVPTAYAYAEIKDGRLYYAEGRTGYEPWSNHGSVPLDDVGFTQFAHLRVERLPSMMWAKKAPD